ncbi:MAG: hypothetical protein RSC66_13480, partial [Comamonas sp.]
MEILIVDRDGDFARRLKTKLLDMGRKADLFECCQRACEPALERNYSLLIVNVEKVGDECSRFIESFNKASSTPVIVVSRNAEIEAKIH